MWNGDSRSADRHGAWTGADWCGGQSPSCQTRLVEMPSRRSVVGSTRRLGDIPACSRHRPVGTPISARLETRTKESDMCASQRCEHACRDPKDGELCLSGAKPEETLVEARSDTDVQNRSSDLGIGAKD
ncbi:hypothetical protein L1887_50856 [Cichorium endivia]|nr:hypothetical protein L1887_50856 [Cichorium endivia]